MREVIGDLFEHATTGVLAHGVNCQGAFGAGIAKEVAARWPIAKAKYSKLIQLSKKENADPLIGTVDMVLVSKEPRLAVANCFTQKFYGSNADGKNRFVSYDALDYCMRYLAQIPVPIHLPLIGAGLGGGAPAVCRNIILNAFSRRTDCTIYYSCPEAKYE